MTHLKDLHPKFVGQLRPNSGEGIAFDCPVCGPSHSCIAYFENPLDGKEPASWSVQWKRDGDTPETLTLSPSIQYPCFHGWVENGLVFDVRESPLHLPNERGQVIALSPNQSETICRNVLNRIDELRKGHNGIL